VKAHAYARRRRGRFNVGGVLVLSIPRGGEEDIQRWSMLVGNDPRGEGEGDATLIE
jgi:hypothetical protein